MCGRSVTAFFFFPFFFDGYLFVICVLFVCVSHFLFISLILFFSFFFVFLL